MARGTAWHTLRVPEETWDAAIEAFPSERGKPGGLSAELQGFVAFLAERPDEWKALKAKAEEQGVSTWQLVAMAVDRPLAQ